MCSRCSKLEFIQLSTGGFVSVFMCRMLMYNRWVHRFSTINTKKKKIVTLVLCIHFIILGCGLKLRVQEFECVFVYACDYDIAPGFHVHGHDCCSLLLHAGRYQTPIRFSSDSCLCIDPIPFWMPLGCVISPMWGNSMVTRARRSKSALMH